MMLLMNASKDALLARLKNIANLPELERMQEARDLYADLKALSDYLYARGYSALWYRIRDYLFPTSLARGPYVSTVEKYILEAAEWELRHHDKCNQEP